MQNKTNRRRKERPKRERDPDDPLDCVDDGFVHLLPGLFYLSCVVVVTPMSPSVCSLVRRRLTRLTGGRSPHPASAVWPASTCKGIQSNGRRFLFLPPQKHARKEASDSPLLTFAGSCAALGLWLVRFGAAERPRERWPGPGQIELAIFSRGSKRASVPAPPAPAAQQGQDLYRSKDPLVAWLLSRRAACLGAAGRGRPPRPILAGLAPGHGLRRLA